jgi:orotate phosphoribosyltransferase
MNHRDELLSIIRDYGVVRGKVNWSDGRESHYYLDLRRVALSARSASLVGQVMLDLTKDLDFAACGGLTMNADPIACAMMHVAARAERGLDAFVVRVAGAAHGLQKRIEGPDIVGRRVLLVEDTCTTGNSVRKALDAVREAGAIPVAVAVVADRDTGAREKIEAEGIPYRSAYWLDDLGVN